MNRKDFIQRAVECCLAVKSDLVTPHVIIIDGKSSDGTYELLVEKYSKNPNIRIIQKDPIGFQRTAYFGAMEVETEYATYMYDDDVLSPYYIQLVDQMISKGRDFVMGYGKMHDVNEALPFLPIKTVDVRKVDAILAYFGDPGALRFAEMPPVSPICCVFKTDFLKRWVSFSQDFAKRSKFRHYFMVDQNIGPDEIIFLANIMNQKDSVLLAEQIVGQFSAHDDSMSIRYGGHHLRVGYWIGRIWAFERLVAERQIALACKCAGHLLADSVRLFVEMVYLRRMKWFFSVCWEVMQIKKTALLNGFFLTTLGYFFVALYQRVSKKLCPKALKPQ